MAACVHGGPESDLQSQNAKPSCFTHLFGADVLNISHISTASVSRVLSIAQGEPSRALLWTDRRECSLLVQIYMLAARHVFHEVKDRCHTEGHAPDERSCRTLLSAVESCLAAAPDTNPELRATTAMALLKSQTLEALAQMIRAEVSFLDQGGQLQGQRGGNGVDQHVEGQVEQPQQPRMPAQGQDNGRGRGGGQEQGLGQGSGQQPRQHEQVQAHGHGQGMAQGQPGSELEQTQREDRGLPQLRLRLYHSLDEAACLAGWLVETLKVTEQKRSGCVCECCATDDANCEAQHKGLQPHEDTCLVAQLWRALGRSRLADAIAEGLLCLQRTLPRGERDQEDTGGNGEWSHLAAAVRQAHMDQLQLREAAQREFGVRADRPTLSRNLAWMPHGMHLPYGSLYDIAHGYASECLASRGCQLSFAAGVAAVVCASGVGRNTYGLAPGPLVALAGDVLPCLWECGQGKGGAEGSRERLIELVEKRLEVVCALIGKKVPLAIRLGGLVDACRRLVAALVERAGEQQRACDPSWQQQEQQQQSSQDPHCLPQNSCYQEHQEQERWPVGRAEGQQIAAVSSDPWYGTWLAGVTRHEAIDLAGQTLDSLSSIARAHLVQRGRGHGAAGSDGLPPWRPLWWWRQAVQLLPLLTEGPSPRGQGQGPWQPLGRRHRWMFQVLRGAAGCDSRPLSLRAPPDLAHALTVGLLPALERVLRRGPAQVAARGEAEEGVAAEALTTWVLSRTDWRHLLPYADTRHVAGLMSTTARVLWRRVGELEAQGCGLLNPLFESMCYSVTSVVRWCHLVIGLRDALCHPADEGRWAEALRQQGPLGFVCEREACELCRPEVDCGDWRRLVSGGGGSGVDIGSGSGVRRSVGEREACGLCRPVETEGDMGCCSANSGDASSNGSGGGSDTSGGGGSSSSGGGGGDDAGGNGYTDDGCCNHRELTSERQLQLRERVPYSCPARRLGLNTSVALWQLLPPLSRALLVMRPMDAELNLIDMCRALTAVCMRVQAEEYDWERQQSGAATKPPVGGKASRGRGAAAPSGALGGAQGRSAAVDSGVGVANKEGGYCSWRELLLGLQPFSLLKLAMQAQERRARAYEITDPALSALALALPEPFAAALAADPELAACLVRRVRSGGQGGEPDANLAGVLQRVLPALPPCRAVEALEAKCALPLVSRAKRQAAREGLRRAWAARARACVLVGVREVQEALAGR